MYRGTPVALKRLSISPTAELQDQRRVWIVSNKTLKNKFILPLLGIDRDTFKPYFAMVSPWMEQGNAFNYIRKNGTHFLFEAAQGLAYLHSMNSVHGYLRGANILITNDIHACLADFGLTVFSDTTETTNTSTSNRAGNVRWMAPELIDPQRDVYALACVCIELYTVAPPFTGLTDGSVILQVITGKRPSRPGEPLSDELWDRMSECWAEDAKTRPSVEAVVRILEKLCSVEESTHRWSLDVVTAESGSQKGSPHKGSAETGVSHSS
ncbi:kinase-like domain-containing protein [Mycena maculata]|uniref:Kinase-like domain-containing protein n=1 Tax=Mycena maculata TaxID=230809 RepID=A0AAD7IN46_9AGAR|nr:kinase-like domain-containing protein [Mycena maculata]